MKIKKFPVPWVSRNVTFTHYIKEPGQSISVYSEDYMENHSEKETLEFYRRHLRVSFLNKLRNRLWFWKARVVNNLLRRLHLM